jgi:hypothetical protein
MAYLIHTDENNLVKTLRTGLVRIPRSLVKRFNIYQLRKGDVLYLYDFENMKIAGPFITNSDSVKEEKNPRSGPFNGYGKTGSHYHYVSTLVDCSQVFERGMPFRFAGFENGADTFFIKKNDENKITEELNKVNDEKIPLIINISFSGDEGRATVIEINKGTQFSDFSFRFTENVRSILGRKIQMGENLLQTSDREKYSETLKELGKIVYDAVFRDSGLEKVFTRGGFNIYISGEARISDIPFEISYNGGFIFENNFLAFRGDEGKGYTKASIKKVLILADPTGRFSGAYEEGLKLCDLFSEMGISVDFYSRRLSKDRFVERFSQYDIVHFCGHSSGSDLSPAWDLGGSFFSAQDFENVKRAGVQRSPHFVFSCSCGNTLKLASRLLKAGVKNVVSSRWKITDGDVTDFVLCFYELLIKNSCEVGYAFNRALCESYKGKNPVPLAFSLFGESRIIYEKSTV